MNWLFLRSAHKGCRSTPIPDPVLDPWSDMWCGLFAEIVAQDGGAGEIRKLGEEWFQRVNDNVVIVRNPDIGVTDIVPDVIFDRGGYREYREIIRRFPRAVTVYYGAGSRYNPVTNYDVILVDTPDQKREVSLAHYGSAVAVFHKPAARSFVPVACEKTRDLVYVCNRPVEAKGCKWLAERIPDGLSVLRIGPPDKWLRKRQGTVEFTGQLRREAIPAQACRARIGVVCDDGQHDSGPRVLPELLAMNIPALVRNTVRADLGAYVTADTGMVAQDDDCTGKIRELLVRADGLTPRAVYDERFAMSKAAQQIIELVRRDEKAHA